MGAIRSDHVPSITIVNRSLVSVHCVSYYNNENVTIHSGEEKSFTRPDQVNGFTALLTTGSDEQNLILSADAPAQTFHVFELISYIVNYTGDANIHVYATDSVRGT